MPSNVFSIEQDGPIEKSYDKWILGWIQGANGVRVGNRTPHNSAYWQSVKPIMFMLRLFGRFAYNDHSDGVLRHSRVSLWSLYSWTLFGALLYKATGVCIEYYQVLAAQGFPPEEVLLSFIMGSFIIYQFTTPVALMYETPKLISYINQWKNWEELYLLVTGTPIKNNFKKFITITIGVGSVVYLIVLYGFNYMLLVSSYSHLIIFSVILWQNCLYIALWQISSIHAIVTAKALRGKLKQALTSDRGLSRTVKLSKIRNLWLLLSAQHQQCMSVVAVTGVLMTQICIFIFIVSSYATLLSVVQWKFQFKTIGYATISPFMGFAFYSTCFVIHIATSEVGKKFAVSLFKIDLTPLDSKTVAEVSAFIQTIKAKPPVVSMSGYIVLNKRTFSAFISTAVTYLIVLVQFKTSGK